MVRAGEKAIVDYRLKLEDGTEYVNTEKLGQTFEFIAGKGTMLPDFEYTVMGMSVGESRSIHTPVDRAYGLRDESLVISVPPAFLPNGEPIPEGATIGISTPDGIMRAKVLSVTDEAVVLDCNHALAGNSSVNWLWMVRR